MNNYHRFINLPFKIKKPSIFKTTDNIDDNIREGGCGLPECVDRCQFGSITACYDKSFWDSIKDDLKENENNIQSFLDNYNLFSDNPLYFWTKPGDNLHIHVDNNKETNYFKKDRKPTDYIDDHAKINITWGPPESKMQWWTADDSAVQMGEEKDDKGEIWKILYAKEKDCTLVYEKSITRPSLVNGGRLHSVINPSKIEGRLTQSFNIVGKSKLETIKFDEALEIFKEYIL